MRQYSSIHACRGNANEATEKQKVQGQSGMMIPRRRGAESSRQSQGDVVVSQQRSDSGRELEKRRIQILCYGLGVDAQRDRL
jgi:hypothetical protein